MKFFRSRLCICGHYFDLRQFSGRCPSCMSEDSVHILAGLFGIVILGFWLLAIYPFVILREILTGRLRLFGTGDAGKRGSNPRRSIGEKPNA